MISRRQFLLSSVATGAGLGASPAHLLAGSGQARADSICNAVSCYARMFPQLARPPSLPNSPLEAALEELGGKMKEGGSGEGRVSAGFTYLGQFVDHDLTLDITPLELAQPNANHIRNFRTPFLDLDQVYGGGPNVSPFLYEMHGPPGNERFLIGMTGKRRSKGPALESKAEDLPRNAKGIALVGDPRQDENLIIAQLHVAFLKFHNRVMDELDTGKKGMFQSVGPAGAARFEQARRVVTWHYQYAVLHEFLAELIDQEVREDVGRKYAAPADDSGSFQIPVEFSAAVFRFGHSMVRDVYNNYNEHHDNVSLPCLLALTGSGSNEVPCIDPPGNIVPFALPADWVIDWSHFFLLANPRLNDARKIDTNIANGLHELKIETVKQFNAAVQGAPPQLTSPKNKLPVRTLLRGARMGLPSGQDVAKVLGLDPLHSQNEIAPDNGRDTEILRNHGLDTDTPLWYYILKEAELKGKPAGGARLGPVGSHIVGDVIGGALRADPGSYLAIDPNWKPKLEIARILELVSA